MEGLTIGQVAKQAGVGVETVRFYERRGLIEQPPRPTSGFRRYSGEVASTIRFIKGAQNLGFTLSQAGALLTLRRSESGACGEVKARAELTLTEVEAKIESLNRLREALKSLIGACEGTLGSSTERCALIEALEERAV